MALVKCKECGKEISDKASTCPNCGCPIDNDIKDNKEKKTKSKKINLMNIIRYIIGAFVFICSLASVKGLGIIICLLSAIMIFPFTTKIIYNKFNIPKALKIILPIICFFLALCFFPKDISTSVKGTNETNAVCRKNLSYGTLTGSETIFLSGNNKATDIEKKLDISFFNLVEGTELREPSLVGLCSKETENANKYSNSFIDCSVNDGNNINIKYTDKNDIERIINDYVNNKYQCIVYSDNKNDVVGNWCLEFDNNGNKNIYHYTFDSNGYYTTKQISGENGKYVDESEGYYSFDGQKIYEIRFVKGHNFYGSAYLDYFTYNKDNDTLINSNIRSEFPNVFTRCD